MLSQNLRSQFKSLSAIEQRKLIDYFIQANITRKMPFIESISNKGLMKVRFIKKLPVNMNASLVNETHISMYIEPTYPENANVNLNFTWNCTQVNETLMQF